MNFEEAMNSLEGVVINLSEIPFTAFEVWFEDQDFYTNMRFIHGDKLFDRDGDVYRVLLVQMAYQAWDYRKAQLNNMEACYIEKKKQVEELEARANKALSVTGSYYDEYDAALLIYVLEKALRGES